jgi:hypothetical protein
MILNAPRGVTRTAGANAYATKFATSPIITIWETRQQEIFYKQSVNNQMVITNHNSRTLTNYHSSIWLEQENLINSLSYQTKKDINWKKKSY